MVKEIYLAGGCFNAAERMHNLLLEKQLQELGYTVVLPQRRALAFLNGDHFDLAAMAEDCKQSCTGKERVVVASIDGTHADDGTSVELGMAIVATGRAVVYRTDFRTAEEKEAGVNAMLKVNGVVYLYHPCYLAELSKATSFYKELAAKIHTAIQSLPE